MFRFFETAIDPFRPHDETMPPADLLGFYWRYCRQVWPFLVALMAIGLIVSLIEIAIVRFVGAIVDTLRATSPETVWPDYGATFLVMGAIILIARPLATLAHDLVTQQAIAPGMTNLIRWQTHHYVVRQSLAYFANDFAGRIASNVVQAAPSLRDSVVQIIDAFWFVTVFAVSALVIFMRMDLRLVAPLAFWIVAYIATLVAFVPRIRRRSEQLAHRRATVTGRIVDSYTNIQTVKLFAHVAREDDHARDSLADHLAIFHLQTRLITLMNLTVSTLNSVLLVGAGGMAIWLWSLHAMTLGDIAVASGLAIRITTMSGWVMWTAIGVFDNVGNVQEGMRTISQPQSLVDRSNAGELKAERGAIRFDHVRFHYGKQGGIIDDLSFAIPPGEKVGLVGRSGAGKSTIVHLLLRFYDLESGRILIDDQDIAEVTQDSLRRQIGVVTQDTSLLHRSVAENILYGNPTATREAMIAAARQAHAHEFIMGLVDPDGRAGYDTLVGERGVKLSGGQRQRIAIARVLLKNAPILVLDEATSALDFGGRGGDPGEPLRADGGQDGDRHRPPPLDHRGDGPADRARSRPDRRDGHARGIARRATASTRALWRRQSGGFLHQE